MSTEADRVPFAWHQVAAGRGVPVVECSDNAASDEGTVVDPNGPYPLQTGWPGGLGTPREPH